MLSAVIPAVVPFLETRFYFWLQRKGAEIERLVLMSAVPSKTTVAKVQVSLAEVQKLS